MDSTTIQTPLAASDYGPEFFAPWAVTRENADDATHVAVQVLVLLRSGAYAEDAEATRDYLNDLTSAIAIALGYSPSFIRTCVAISANRAK
jgi:hypothetical protein